MKKLLLFLGVLIFVTCKSEQELSTSSEMKLLVAEGARKYLPIEYQSNSLILYKSKSGVLKTINSVFNAATPISPTVGQTYQRDQFNVIFTESTDPSFAIFISGIADYIEKHGIVNSVSITAMPSTPFWTVGSIFVNDKGEFQKSPVDDFYETLNLNNKSFSNCFKFKGAKTDAFSEFYLNSDVGLVAFRDKENDLFVFEKFIK